jgi:hypothetical protein
VDHFAAAYPQDAASTATTANRVAR